MNPTKRPRPALLLTLCAALLALGLTNGCKFFGPNPAGPSAAESTFFEVKTNFVEQVLYKTNLVSVTVPVPVFVTNEVGQIVVHTNEVPVLRYELLTVTNVIPVYDWTPRPESQQTAQTIGGVINTFLPGVGTAVSGALLGLLAAWAKLRSSKKTGVVLAQNVETLLEFIKTLPNGGQYDTVLKQYLQQNQVETGTANQVIAILDKYVSNPDAKAGLVEIQNLLASLQPAVATKP